MPLEAWTPPNLLTDSHTRTSASVVLLSLVVMHCHFETIAVLMLVASRSPAKVAVCISFSPPPPSFPFYLSSLPFFLSSLIRQFLLIACLSPFLHYVSRHRRKRYCTGFVSDLTYFLSVARLVASGQTWRQALPLLGLHLEGGHAD